MNTPTINNAPQVRGVKSGWSWSFITIIAAGLLFLGYVLSAPLVIRQSVRIPQAYKPVFSAAAEGPFSWILKPYFKLWGIEFQPAKPEPPRQNYE